MAAGLFWKILFSMVSLGVASTWNEGVCTKLILNRFKIYKFDKDTQRIVADEKVRKTISFVCCEGYRERSRRKELPNCEPICRQSCGYGYCYRPNRCACYYGYEISDSDGTCKRIGTAPRAETNIQQESSTRRIFDTSTPATSTVKLFQQESWTRRVFDTKPTSTPATSTVKLFQQESWTRRVLDRKQTSTVKVAIDQNDGSIFKMTTSSEQHSTEATSFPRVKFITHQDSDLGSTNADSEEVESSPQPIGFQSPIESGEDFPRVKFIPHTGNNRTKNLANCTDGVCACRMGYELSEQRLCTPCRVGTRCQCQDGYAFDSFRCKPLCNGSFDGCIRGNCIGYNECSCFDGAEKHADDKFHCYFKETHSLELRRMDAKWLLLLLLIPAVSVGIISLYLVLQRSRSSKSNRLKAQRNQFPEIRYFNANNGCGVEKLSHAADGMIANASGFGGNTNVVIIRT